MQLWPSLRKRPDFLIIPILALCAFIPRFVMAITTFTSTVDTSTVGIMGLHILKGDRPLFYYGQNYMGALEGYGTAVMFKLFGVSLTTLTLTPTLFTMGWTVAMYVLFSRIFNRLGGIAAALCVAIPGWYAIWYTMGSYGGYPETYFLGTLAILIALMLTRETATNASPRLVVLLGLVLALGIWTNLQVLPFFVVAAIVVGTHWLVRNRTLTRAIALSAAGSVALLGFVPGMLLPKDPHGSSMIQAPQLSRIRDHLDILLERMLPKLIWWKYTDSDLLRHALAVLLILPIVFYLASLIRKRDEPRRLIPLVFALAFLALYLPHEMAAIGAPRYAISAVIMLVSAGFAAMLCSDWRMARVLGALMLMTWTGYNGVSIARKCHDGAEEKPAKVASRMRVIDAARQHGFKNVMMLGSSTEGLRGLILSFYSRCDVAFTSCRAERVYAHSDAWEQDDNGAFAFRPGVSHFITGALSAMAIDQYEVIPAGAYTLLGNITPRFVRQTAVDDIAVTRLGGFIGASDAIIDRRASSVIRPADDGAKTVVLALSEPTTISGLRIFGIADDMPYGPYEVAVSTDGVAFTTCQQVDRRTAQSYRAGNRIYLKGRYAAQDIGFVPVTARHVRLTYAPTPGQTPHWDLSEVLVLKHLGDGVPVSQDEVKAIAELLRGQGVTFTYCDRWLSRKLLPSLNHAGTKPPVFPTYNSRYPESEMSRDIVLDAGHAIAVDHAYTQQARGVLERHLAEGFTLQTHEYDHYTALLITGVSTTATTEPALTWNGHTVLEK